MAILGQIQKRSGVLIGIIALALFAFVIQGLIKNSSSIGKGSATTIAEVGDRKIPTQEFQKRVALLQKQNKNLSNMQAMNIVWDQMIKEAVLNNQFDKLGIQVGKDRVRELIINNPSIKQAFTNEQGVFDENALLDYIQNIEDNKNRNPEMYSQWKNFENSLIEQEKEKIYMDMIKASINPTLKEGEWLYHNENDAVDFSYAAVPYNTVPDSLVKVTKEDIAAYIKKNDKQFKVDESRDMEYIFIPIEPSVEDKEAIKKEMIALINDKEVYDKDTKGTKLRKGFKNTDKPEEFAAQFSDVKLPAKYYFKNELPKQYADTLINLNKGDVFGPYEVNNRLYLSRAEDVIIVPDSAKASHILIAYKGALRANPAIQLTQDQAKKKADSLLRVVKRNPSKFAEYAKEFSDGPTKTKGGDLGWFTYGQMVPEFNDFVFKGKKGQIGLVKTDFGYHIIKIEDLTKPEKAVKLVSITKGVEPSMKTEDKIYSKASKLTAQAMKTDDFNAFAKENGYVARPVRRLGRYEDNIPGIGINRQVVKWMYDKDTKLGDVNKFDLNNGHLIVKLTGIHDEGLMSPEEASALVKPILLKKKKAEIIKKKMQGATLEEIAQNSGAKIGKATGVTLKNPIIPGYGKEPKVVAIAFVLEPGKLSSPIDGNRAVYVINTIKVNKAQDIKNYIPYVEQIKKKELIGLQPKVIEALKKSNEIEDKRSMIY
jgi:parvulin-like peptidyl-prolyl isomerase